MKTTKTFIIDNKNYEIDLSCMDLSQCTTIEHLIEKQRITHLKLLKVIFVKRVVSESYLNKKNERESFLDRYVRASKIEADKNKLNIKFSNSDHEGLVKKMIGYIALFEEEIRLKSIHDMLIDIYYGFQTLCPTIIDMKNDLRGEQRAENTSFRR